MFLQIQSKYIQCHEINITLEYKKLKMAGIPHRIHEGKQIALLFEKNSTRTRTAFVVAARDLGMQPEFLGKDDIQLGKKRICR